MVEIEICRTLKPLFFRSDSLTIEHSGWRQELEYSIDSPVLTIQGIAKTPENQLIAGLKAALVALGYEESQITVDYKYVIDYTTDSLVEVDEHVQLVGSESIKTNKLVTKNEFFEVANQVWKGKTTKLDVNRFSPRRGFKFVKTNV